MIRLALALLALASPAAAEAIPCQPVARMVEHLREKWGERMAGHGTGVDNRHVIFARNADTGTWTFLVILPNGNACITAAGVNWQELAQGDPA